MGGRDHKTYLKLIFDRIIFEILRDIPNGSLKISFKLIFKNQFGLGGGGASL